MLREVTDLEVAALTASRMVTADLGQRRLEVPPVIVAPRNRRGDRDAAAAPAGDRRGAYAEPDAVTGGCYSDPRERIACLGCEERILARARGAILCAVMAGGAQCGIALSMLAHFVAATRKVA